jgi:hypothetical protein
MTINEESEENEYPVLYTTVQQPQAANGSKNYET